MSIPNGANGIVVPPRRRDVILVLAHDKTELNTANLQQHWPFAERFEHLGPNLWCVVGVVLSPDGRGSSPKVIDEVTKTANAIPRFQPVRTDTTTVPPRSQLTHSTSDPSISLPGSVASARDVPEPILSDNPHVTQAELLSDSSRSREVRVFISSTFRDMHAERDLLVKEVFPELRSKCAQRCVIFTEVDLRWGVTEEQANEGQVLPLCLAEIERSRPYFIGLLGERYGWIPETIRPEVIERQAWLKEHLESRTSVTELEILHGVLNNPRMADHAFFYFRDPAYVRDAGLTEDERHEMVDAM